MLHSYCSIFGQTPGEYYGICLSRMAGSTYKLNADSTIDLFKSAEQWRSKEKNTGRWSIAGGSFVLQEGEEIKVYLRDTLEGLQFLVSKSISAPEWGRIKAIIVDSIAKNELVTTIKGYESKSKNEDSRRALLIKAKYEVATINICAKDILIKIPEKVVEENFNR